MKFSACLLFANLIHLSTAAEKDLFACIRDLSPLSSPLGFSGDDTACDHFSSAFGPSISYCTNQYSFSTTTLIRGEEGQAVYSILQVEGDVVEISTDGSHHVVLKHEFDDSEDDSCVFNDEEVDSIYIKYSHVDVPNSNGVPKYGVGDTIWNADDLLLGNLVHESSTCSNPPYKSTPHTSLGVTLYAGYPDGTRSHPISPTLLFGMDDDTSSLSFTHTNLYYGRYYVRLWDESEDSNLPVFHIGEDAAINITGTKCQTDYNQFYIKCVDADTTAGEDSQWDHTIELNERSNTQTALSDEVVESSVHFKPHPYGHSNSEWSTTLFIPADVTSGFWDGAGESCRTECYLEVFDVKGRSMGAFPFNGIGDVGDSCEEEDEG